MIPNKEEMTTISISKKLKDELDMQKIHPRETYQDILERLIVKKGVN